MDQDKVKQNILSGAQWLRMLFMAGYILATWVLGLVLLVVILVQTLVVLITGETNPNLRRFGILCGVYIHQIVHFLVYGSDEKPFPFSEFPDIDSVVAGHSAEVEAEAVPPYTYDTRTYDPGNAPRTSQTQSSPVYGEIIPSADSVNTDDEFPLTSTSENTDDDFPLPSTGENTDEEFPPASTGGTDTNPERNS